MIALLTLPMISCLDTDEEQSSGKWREENETWIEKQLTLKNDDGTDYYTRVEAVWNPQAYVLMHWHNDRKLTQDKLSPLSNSTTDVKYIVYNCRDVAVDSSYLRTQPADSIYRSRVNANINGWILALTKMKVGDSCTIIIPYQQAYGIQGSGTVAPYTSLKYGVKLCGIPGYNTPIN